MRAVQFVPREHYHLFGRGNYKQDVFLDKRDYTRFLFLILYFQSEWRPQNISRQISHYVKHSVFNIKPSNSEKVASSRHVKLINFCLMPNHYHLTVEETERGGISTYMQRLLNGFTKYHNAKYEKTGHLFQGPFKAVHVKNNTQLLHLSSYIHRNPRELKTWIGKEQEFPWSSYQDYLGKNRWGELLVPDLILDQFDVKNTYRTFVETSPAKQFEGLEDYINS